MATSEWKHKRCRTCNSSGAAIYFKSNAKLTKEPCLAATEGGRWRLTSAASRWQIVVATAWIPPLLLLPMQWQMQSWPWSLAVSDMAHFCHLSSFTAWKGVSGDHSIPEVHGSCWATHKKRVQHMYAFLRSNACLHREKIRYHMVSKIPF